MNFAVYWALKTNYLSIYLSRLRKREPLIALGSQLKGTVISTSVGKLGGFPTTHGAIVNVGVLVGSVYNLYKQVYFFIEVRSHSA